MEVKIIKGTNQIGGCITEISTNKTKIIIDFGDNLPDEEKVKNEPLKIEGLTNGKSIYDAVFITHSHGDHIGRINEINLDIDIYVEKDTKLIHNLTCEFTGNEIVTRKTNDFEFGKSIVINNDIVVTPYIVDHSSYNSCMFLIEADGKKVVHTGDYRNHGKKGKVFEHNLKTIGEVDCLITEGTTFGRSDEKYKTEEQLYQEAVKKFREYDDILILQSSTNIDRLVSFYRASKATNKYFVEDLFSATIASNLLKTIPSPISGHSKVSVWIPFRYNANTKSKEFMNKYVVPMEPYKNDYAFHHDVCMLVKTSMIGDIKFLKNEKHQFKNACLIYSMWDGYLEKEELIKFKNEIEEMGITFKKLHTSGHSDNSAMLKVKDTLKPKMVIPIHTTNKERAKEIFDNVIEMKDGENILV